MSDIRNLQDGHQYTFAQIETLAGKAIADRARDLAGVPRQREPEKVTPTSMVKKTTRKTATPTGTVPERTETQRRRLGDRLKPEFSE